MWVKRQLLDTDAWVSSSGALLESEDVREALSISLVETLFANTDVEVQLAARLPEDLAGLGRPLAGLLREVAVPAAEQLLSTAQAQALWEEINRRTQSQLVALLEDRETEGALTTEEGAVVLDLSTLVERLGDRLGVEVMVPPGTAVITIMSADQLDAAQTSVRVVNALTVFLGLVVLALLALAVYLARGFRRLVLLGAGGALLLVGILLLVLRRIVGDAIIDALTSAATEPAGGAVWLIATDLLGDVAIALIVYGAVALAGAWLAGPSRPATWLRRQMAPALRAHPAIVYAGVALVFLLVILWSPTGTGRRLFGIIILGVLVLVGVTILRRQILREYPERAEIQQLGEDAAAP